MEDQIIHEKAGYKIRLEPRSFTFAVLAPEGGYLKQFPSYEQAENWITIELRESAKKDRRTLALSAITEQGVEVVLIGVNINTGKLKLDKDGNYDGTIYPNTPTLKRLVVELHKARQTARLLTERLHPCGIRNYSSGRLESANYENYIKSIEKRFSEAATATAKLDQEKAA